MLADQKTMATDGIGELQAKHLGKSCRKSLEECRSEVDVYLVC